MRNLQAEGSKKGRNTETRRRKENAWSTDSHRPNDTTSNSSGVTAYIRTTFFGKQLWFQTKAKRTSGNEAGVGILQRGIYTSSRFRPCKVFWYGKSRDTDRNVKGADKGRKGHKSDTQISEKRSDDKWSDESDKRGNAAGRKPLAASEQHISHGIWQTAWKQGT